MNDSTTQTEETLSAKEQYEAAIEKSDRVPQSKIIGEFVLDALINASGESSKIRELRLQIKSAIDSGNDDEAFTLMNELKTIKDAEQESASALTEISSKFTVSQILSSFKTDPAFEEIVYGLALKVLTQTNTALTSPSGKSKTPREKTAPKPALVYVISKGEESAKLVMRIGKGAANLVQDAEAFTLLGFEIEKDAEGRDTLVPATFADKMGVEHPASRRTIATAIEEKTAFEGYTIATKE